MTSTAMAFHLAERHHHLFCLDVSGWRQIHRPAVFQELNLLQGYGVFVLLKGREEEEKGDAGGDYSSLLRSGSWQSEFISAFSSSCRAAAQYGCVPVCRCTTKLAMRLTCQHWTCQSDRGKGFTGGRAARTLTSTGQKKKPQKNKEKKSCLSLFFFLKPPPHTRTHTAQLHAYVQ